VLYWTIEEISGTITEEDFTTGISGSVTINSNAASFTITVAADITEEGEESFIVRLRTGSTSGTIVANSSTIVINDTSFSRLYIGTGNIKKIYKGETEIVKIYRGETEIYKK